MAVRFDPDFKVRILWDPHSHNVAAGYRRRCPNNWVELRTRGDLPESSRALVSGKKCPHDTKNMSRR